MTSVARFRTPQTIPFSNGSRLFCSSVPLQFPLSTVLQCSSHQDNKRLFGFILQAAGGRVVCYIFESNNDGEKVARALVC